MSSDIKTRVTPLDEIRVHLESGHDCLVVIYSSDSRQLGKKYPLGEEPLTMGREPENTVVLEADSVSRQHCRIEQSGRHYIIKDNNSTNGTYVNDEPVTSMQLRRGDQVKVGDTIFKFLAGSDVEAQYHETIYRMTINDGLTGTYNKRYLLETLEKEIPRARRYGRPLSLVMFDVDHFKKVNDSYGHLAGDFVLKELCNVARGRLRPDDVLARYGGEEFAILLPETGCAGAIEIAEQIRSLIEKHVFKFEGEKIPVTSSFGVAELGPDADELSFIKHADEKLYRAKNAGRNRVV